MRKKIGYDLDGVIAPRRLGWWMDLCWWIALPFGSFIAHYRLGKPKLTPPEKAVIITGRAGQEYGETLRWLKQHGIKNKLYMNIGNYRPDIQRSINWKVQMINALKITQFYDDDPKTIEVLRKETKAKIYLVK